MLKKDKLCLATLFPPEICYKNKQYKVEHKTCSCQFDIYHFIDRVIYFDMPIIFPIQKTSTYYLPVTNMFILLQYRK